MHRHFLIFSLLLSAIHIYGQGSPIERRLDSMLTTQFKGSEPGGVVLVAKGASIMYNKAFGSANLELGVPLRPDMVFKLASITKQFTAVAILQLVESGKISLADSLQKFVPDYPSGGQRITIEHLLTHTSGIPDYMQIDFRNQNMERWDFTPKQLIDSFKNYPLKFIPGSRFAYSNSGYYLLGYIIEQVSGKSYQRYVQDHILTPAGLTHSYFDSAGVIIPKRVAGYRKEGAVFKNADFWSPAIAYAAGGLLSTTEDLFQWFRSILSYKVIKKETVQKAFTPFRLKDGAVIRYGYGWHVFNSGAVKSIEHGGHMNGFITNQIYYPEEDVFIVVLLNCQDAPRDELSQKISEIVLGHSLQAEVVPDERILNTYAGTYVLTTDPKRTIVITKKGNGLVANISGQQSFELLFQNDRKFALKNLKDISGEFVSDGGRVSKLIVEQNGRFEWKKVK